MTPPPAPLPLLVPGDEVYREWGWSMFRGFEMFCKLPTGGYQILVNVAQVGQHAIWGEQFSPFYIAYSKSRLEALRRTSTCVPEPLPPL